jgi:hypothetical protein
MERASMREAQGLRRPGAPRCVPERRPLGRHPHAACQPAHCRRRWAEQDRRIGPGDPGVDAAASAFAARWWWPLVAALLARAKEVRDDGSMVEVVVWELPEPLLPCTHRYKYRLYFGSGGTSRVRYDNERGKGDHRHIDEAETPYTFITVEQLLDDFERDVAHWRPAS